MIPITGLFEAHLTVARLDRSVAFYERVLGLTLASRFDERRCAFFWLGPAQQAMLGLWETGDGPQQMRLHVAFRVELSHLQQSCEQLRNAGLTPLGFSGEPTNEPVVLAWMPAASVYFRDLDGHLLEFLAMLPDQARPDLGVLAWSAWAQRGAPGARGSDEVERQGERG